MKKALASLALLFALSLFIQLTPVLAQDGQQVDGFLYPPLPPMNQVNQERIWQEKETTPHWNDAALDSPYPDTGQTSGRNLLSLGSLGNRILQGMNQEEQQPSAEDKDALLVGEPQDASCVMGLRYSFSEFDLAHFCKSFFSLVGAGKGPREHDDQGFSFYVD